MQVDRLVGCVLLAITSCGGAVTADPYEHGDAAPDAQDSDVHLGDAGDTSSSGDPCRTASGIRLCGGECPALTDAECPGLGCVPVIDRETDAPVGIGVCLADLPAPVAPCWMCSDGRTCSHLQGQGIVCVDEDVCVALHALGFGRGCRYADFSPYDGRPLKVETTDCPKRSCGPGCGACENGGSCSGRSADFGYGFCLPKQDPIPCHASDAPSAECPSCLTWLPSTGGDDVALQFGVCVADPLCPDYEATGRMSCH